MKNKTYHKRKILIVFGLCFAMILGLVGRLIYLMIFQAEYYQERAEALHEREREIKAARGLIVDRNQKILAANQAVCTISVIHNQIKDPEQVIRVLSEELGISGQDVRKRVEKVSSIERIKTNVEKETGDRIREYGLAGVKVDEDYKRYYPYGNLASKVLGFTGGDNQGIIGLEVKYEDILKGKNGRILTLTDARGLELEKKAEDRIEPIPGNTLEVTLDYNLQTYAQQAAEKVMEEKQAQRVFVILMNPKNGEILAMVNVPEFDLNEPFTLNTDSTGKLRDATQADDSSQNSDVTGEKDPGTEETTDTETQETDAKGENISAEEKQNLLNQMWRNGCINDTYEPGSTFKIITASACLEEGVVSLEDTFSCPGYRVVEDRRIRCHKVGGHGAETFVQGIQNSCNPVFIDIGLRLGADRFYEYFQQFGLMGKTGIDLPGEAATIMHKKDNIGLVELATMSFGQSFQITPIQMAVTVSSLINGGTRVTPHFAKCIRDQEGEVIETFSYPKTKGVVSKKTSETMRTLLESVVAEGSGKNGAVEGYRIGGKTATSQTLPRSANKYISSFIGFAPANDPQILGMVVIHDPQGIYYGGTIAAPVLRDIFENALPYLGIEKGN